MIEINKIYNEDCFSILSQLEDKSVDLVFIDPPYEISKSSGYVNNSEHQIDYIKKYGKHTIDFGEWDKNFDGLELAVKESYRILKDGGTFICFYDLWEITKLKNYMEDAKFKQLRFIEWIKTNPVPINSKLNYLTNSREVALMGVKKSKPTFNSEYDNGIYSYPIYHSKDRFHPTQKSVELYKDIIKKHSNEGDLVVDFFAGSCTTAISSIETNRNYICVELDEKYYKLSVNRVNQLLKGASINGD